MKYATLYKVMKETVTELCGSWNVKEVAKAYVPFTPNDCVHSIDDCMGFEFGCQSYYINVDATTFDEPYIIIYQPIIENKKCIGYKCRRFIDTEGKTRVELAVNICTAIINLYKEGEQA